MGDIEKGICNYCNTNTELTRKYYHFKADCECCNGDDHFEIVKYCKDCEPKQPERVSFIPKKEYGGLYAR